MKLTALVPMKAHSERVPNKNMRLLDGRPLYHHIVQTLQNSLMIDTILINTDSKTIADNAAKIICEVDGKTCNNIDIILHYFSFNTFN